jgi:hypothetical protein
LQHVLERVYNAILELYIVLRLKSGYAYDFIAHHVGDTFESWVRGRWRDVLAWGLSALMLAVLMCYRDIIVGFRT